MEKQGSEIFGSDLDIKLEMKLIAQVLTSEDGIACENEESVSLGELREKDIEHKEHELMTEI